MSNFDRNAANRFGSGITRTDSAYDQGLRSYMIGVYNYMALGLAITGLVAYGVFMTAVVQNGGTLELTSFGQALFNSPLRWLVMLAPLGFVMAMSFGQARMSAATTRLVFFAFSAVMGLSLSSILLVYTATSVANAFFISAATFGALSLYGYTTSRSLSAMGHFMMMALFGLIIASLFGIFFHSAALQIGISMAAVVIFAGLTAWDTQAIKQMYAEGDGVEMTTKKSVFGALQLYLDFINIFIALLRLTGDRR